MVDHSIVPGIDVCEATQVPSCHTGDNVLLGSILHVYGLCPRSRESIRIAITTRPFRGLFVSV